MIKKISKITVNKVKRFEYIFKCINFRKDSDVDCGLEFKVFTHCESLWDKKLRSSRRYRQIYDVYCPECGRKGAILLRKMSFN